MLSVSESDDVIKVSQLVYRWKADFIRNPGRYNVFKSDDSEKSNVH